MREWLLRRMEREAAGNCTAAAEAAWDDSGRVTSDGVTERTRLLDVRSDDVEEIALDTLSGSCDLALTVESVSQLADDDQDDIELSRL